MNGFCVHFDVCMHDAPLLLYFKSCEPEHATHQMFSTCVGVYVLARCLSSANGSCMLILRSRTTFLFKSQAIIAENSSIVHLTLLFAKYSHSLARIALVRHHVCSCSFVCSSSARVRWYFPPSTRKSAAKFGQKALKIHFMHKCQNIHHSNPWSHRLVNWMVQVIARVKCNWFSSSIVEIFKWQLYLWPQRNVQSVNST